jgi:hypothetical protein
VFELWVWFSSKGTKVDNGGPLLLVLPMLLLLLPVYGAVTGPKIFQLQQTAAEGT